MSGIYTNSKEFVHIQKSAGTRHPSTVLGTGGASLHCGKFERIFSEWNKKNSFFVVIALLLISSSGALGVTPDIRFPEWYKTKIFVSAWDPASKIVEVTLEVEAINVLIRDPAVELFWPEGFDPRTPPQRAASIESGKTYKTVHSAVSPEKFDGWMEISVLARPDPGEMRKAVSENSAFSKGHKIILLEETKDLKPIPIGRNFPLHIDSNLAVFSSPELIFGPVWPCKGAGLFLWAPDAGLGTGLTKETYKIFQKSVRDGNLSAALSSLEILEKRISSALEPIELQRSDGKSLFIPVKIILEAISINAATLESVKNFDRGISRLRGFLEKERPGFADGYVHANLGILEILEGRKAQGVDDLKKALEAFPAWPWIRMKIKEAGGME